MQVGEDGLVLKSQRLIQIMMYINAKQSFTVRELADEFGLSTRTITRDLQELSLLGVPLYSVQGRGGGYRMLQERMLPPIAFTESEAMAMFFACQSLQYFGSTPFDEGAETALRKFYHYLPESAKQQIARLKDKVAIWNPQRIMASDVLKTLLYAIMANKVLKIDYDSPSGRAERRIQLIGLYASNGYWYGPSYCFDKEEFRLFRADRIHRAEIDESVQYQEELEQLSPWNETAKNAIGKPVTMTVSLTAKGMRMLQADAWFASFLEQQKDGTGRAVLPITEDKLNYYADLFWQLGEDAVILSPPQAVHYIKSKLDAVAANYR
jgi:predicted DNA-binding transcriptional regulator YafY